MSSYLSPEPSEDCTKQVGSDPLPFVENYFQKGEKIWL